jgi:hypothetical protein
MNSLVIKAICRRIEDRYGSNKKAAVAADVSGGVWSNYCSDEHPDTTIPVHRFLLCANAAERAALAKLLLDEGDTAPPCVLTETSEAFEAAGALHKKVRLATADGKPTLNEKREIREEALEVQGHLADVIKAAGAA